jgi:hypothetical protein
MYNKPSDPPIPYENRFLEVVRKSREARARLKANSDIRAAAEERRIADARAENAERDRQVDRDARFAADQPENNAARGTSASSALQKAAAQLDGQSGGSDQ